MKKIVLGLTAVTCAVTLSGCDNGDDVVSTELLDTFKDAIYENFGDSIGAKYDNVDAYIANGYTYDDYVGFNFAVPAMVDIFAGSFADANITVKQLNAILENLNEFPNLSSDDYYSELLEAVYEVKLSSDQIINIFFYSIMDFEQNVLDAINSVPEKSDYLQLHEGFVDDFQEMCSEFGISVLSTLTDENRVDALTFGKVTLGDTLDYTYGLESVLSTLTNLVEGDFTLTEDTLFALIEANNESFKDSFGKTTKSEYEAAIKILVDFNTALDPEFDLGMTVELAASTTFNAKEAVGDMFDELTNKAYKATYFTLYKEMLTGSFENVTEQTQFDSAIIVANCVTSGLTNFSNSELESMGLTTLKAAAAELSKISFGTTYVEETHADLIYNLFDALV